MCECSLLRAVNYKCFGLGEEGEEKNVEGTIKKQKKLKITKLKLNSIWTRSSWFMYISTMCMERVFGKCAHKFMVVMEKYHEHCVHNSFVLFESRLLRCDATLLLVLLCVFLCCKSCLCCKNMLVNMCFRCLIKCKIHFNTISFKDLINKSFEA